MWQAEKEGVEKGDEATHKRRAQCQDWNIICWDNWLVNNANDDGIREDVETGDGGHLFGYGQRYNTTRDKRNVDRPANASQHLLFHVELYVYEPLYVYVSFAEPFHPVCAAYGTT